MSTEKGIRGKVKEEHESSLIVSKKKINNKYYLLTEDNIVLDINSYDILGVYVNKEIKEY